jgi:hypothetical protein
MKRSFRSLVCSGLGLRRFWAAFRVAALVSVVAGGAMIAPGGGAQITSTLEGTVSDQKGLTVAGAEIYISSAALAVERRVLTDSAGVYRIAGLPAGIYTVTVSKDGFTTEASRNLELTLNQTVALNVTLKVGSRVDTVEVSAAAPLLESVSSSSGSTITPAQIEQMPINGRNYLDLLQLVPGVTINRQADQGSDTATPILGDRAGNAAFLIDGMPNSDQLNGGPAAQFNQDSIMEFQVLTGGYKAEFGHGSGGVINVLSKSGSNDLHGGASFFHRNYKLDSSDSSQVNSGKAPFLLRWDPTMYLGGPVLKDKVFFFGSVERILETRELNFQFPAGVPASVLQNEVLLDKHNQTFDTRVLGKLDEQWGHHRISQQVNLTNTHVTNFLPLSQASTNLPSTRNNIDSRHLLLGLTDTFTLGNQSNPFLVNLYLQYRGEPTRIYATNTANGLAFTAATLFNDLVSGVSPLPNGFFTFGPGHTPETLFQKYFSTGANVSKVIGRHAWKFGWDFQRINLDGTEASSLFNQSFATVADFAQFGAVNSGVYFLNEGTGRTPQDDQIGLRNNYDGLFAQDDWKVARNLTLNLGLRWDYDSEFPNKANFSPRLGFAWSITPKTVLRGSWGLFYDHFRSGTARNIPGFGGSNVVNQPFLSFPRLFFGNPVIAPGGPNITALFAGLGAPCASTNLSEAQVVATGATCPTTGRPLFGFDFLNSIVAPGHAPIPANVPVNVSNVQALTGLTPQQFATQASAAVGSPGVFTFDPFGSLSTSSIFPAAGVPITIAPGFKTPYTSGAYVGLQRQISDDAVAEVGYYHKDIHHILGVRNTNLSFAARLTNDGATSDGKPLTFGYGPWYAGTYDSVIVSFKKRTNKWLTLETSYTWAHETDDVLNSSLLTDLQSRSTAIGSIGASFSSANGPTDSFVGIVPVVTEPSTGKTNANGPFVAANGNPVPQAGKFYNGPSLDKGPSDFSVDHTFLIDGIVNLPWKFDLSPIFRAQSGFHYSAQYPNNAGPDVDGDGLFNNLDFAYGRNHYVSPPYVDMDLRVAKHFAIKERVKLHLYLEFFNLFNRANPAAIDSTNTTITTPPTQPVAPFGTVSQVLPGREGQAGIRIDF